MVNRPMGTRCEPTIFRGTTPTIILKIKNENFDMATIDVCHVTIQNDNGKNKKVFENPNIDIDEKTISVPLSQNDTLDYQYGNINIQAKIKLKDTGTVITHKILTTTMDKILEEAIL